MRIRIIPTKLQADCSSPKCMRHSPPFDIVAATRDAVTNRRLTCCAKPAFFDSGMTRMYGRSSEKARSATLRSPSQRRRRSLRLTQCSTRSPAGRITRPGEHAGLIFWLANEPAKPVSARGTKITSTADTRMGARRRLNIQSSSAL